mmetsp:Transcript_9692/g.14677  ORF Transcript_9692/g.14677 Transcript_9692/m.14677 type:complete len:608 (+) Transcript_9692:4263-6086(+)
MSLYFAYPTNSNTEQTVSSSVSERGLSLLRAKPCEVHVLSYAASAQPGYASYIQNLPHFMLATARQQVLYIGTGGAPLPQLNDTLPWKLPALIYDFNKKLTERKVETLKDHSDIVASGRSTNPTFVMRDPSLQLISDLMNDEPKPSITTRHVFGTVNLDAMKTVLMLRNITTGFLLTHRYAAFRTSDDLNPCNVTDDDGVVTKKRKVSTTSYLVAATTPGDHIEDLSAEDLVTMKDAQNPVPIIKLTVAKPSSNTQPIFGSARDIPNADGLFFPYVRDLSISDNLTVPNVIIHYMSKSLGINVHEIVRIIGKLKSAWGLIKDTDFGHEVTHMYKCIDIALKSQAAVFPIFTNGIYEGTVVWGTGYYIGLNDKVYRPLAYDKLLEEINDKSMHSSALQRIIDLCDDNVRNEISDCKSIRGLASIVQRVELTEVSKSQIVKEAHKLCYSNKYWSSVQRYVCRMLDLLTNWNDGNIDADIPMHPSKIFSTGREEVILSAFGHQAPTFLIPNGQNIELREDRDPPKQFHVRMVELNKAIVDMKYVLENGTITNNNSNLSSKHKDSALNGESKKMVWGKLCELYKQGNPVDADSSEVPTGVAAAGGVLDFGW